MNPEGKNREKKDNMAAALMIIMLLSIVAYAGYEYFWRSLERQQLSDRANFNIASTTPQKKEVGGEKITAESPVAPAEKAVVKKQALITAENTAPAAIHVGGAGKAADISLAISSNCQAPASGEAAGSARQTATITGLNLNGLEIPLSEAKELVCTYPSEAREAYVPAPELTVTGIDQPGKKIYLTLAGIVHQGGGPETDWKENFVYDIGKQTIKTLNN